MDPTTVPPEVVNAFLMEAGKSLPSAGFWIPVLGALWWGGKAQVKHLCDLVTQALVIADKFADNGLDVRLTITNLDGDVPAKRKPAAKPKEAADGDR